MIITPMKCKLCGKTISAPDEALIIGQPPQARNQRLIAKLLQHMQTRAEEELKDRNGSARPHTQALVAATVASQNFNGALVIGCFDISPDMEAERQGVLKRIHEMTRTIRIPDTELAGLSKDCDCEGGECTWDAVLEVLKDLRDRYEGLGKYAPPIHTQETVKTQ